MKRFGVLFENLQVDLKAFVYWCLIFSLFRAIFIFIYYSQISTIEFSEILMAMWLGLRMSLKTSGIIVLVGAVFATIPVTCCLKYPAQKVRLIWHSMALVFFTILFFARIPYYKIFNSGFNSMLINGMYDDKYAILITAINEYQLYYRLPAAIIAGFLLAYFLKKVLQTPVLKFQAINHKKIVAVLTVILIPVFWIFVRFGGAFTYEGSINWVSAARLKANLLNEAILDDGQALYRVYKIHEYLGRVASVNFNSAELRNKIEFLKGNKNANTIDDAFLHTVSSSKLKVQPDNIIVILGESYGLWPFLPEFKDLGIVEYGSKFMNSEQSASISTMLAHGTGTIWGVSGLVTGLPASGIYENYQDNTFKTQYHTGIGYIMKQLGYKTVFWYGGFAGWQNVGKFVSSQNFDEFHCADNFKYSAADNPWGCPDKVLFKYVSDYIDKEIPGEKVFHIILTGTNHPPYTLNIDNEGFDRAAMRKNLPDSIANTEENLTDIGHFWYADQQMGKFIERTEIKFPDTLFVITGDHSERFNFAKEEDLKTLSAIPCIFYGKGVDKNWFNDKSVGCHMQIAGTLAEMIAPHGFTYSAILPNMFENQNAVYNHRLWAYNGEIGLQSQNKQIEKIADTARDISAWRILKGNEIE